MVNIQSSVARIVTQVGMECVRRAYSASNELRNAELDVLSKTGHGRQYKNHRASAPGEPPAPVSGNLRRNWNKRVYMVSAGDVKIVTALIETDVPYAGYLEHGTRKMAARPFDDRIREKAMPAIENLFKKPF